MVKITQVRLIWKTPNTKFWVVGPHWFANTSDHFLSLCSNINRFLQKWTLKEGGCVDECDSTNLA